MRKYLPTFADLIDRMSICQLKAIFQPQFKKQFDQEIADIMHDLDKMKVKINAKMIRAIQVNMLANRYMWENESRGVRAGGKVQDGILKITHSINGVRSRAKNIISQELGERIDPKTDCIAGTLLKEKGMNWDI